MSTRQKSDSTIIKKFDHDIRKTLMVTKIFLKLLPEVKDDPVKLQQMTDNLLENIEKAENVLTQLLQLADDKKK